MARRTDTANDGDELYCFVYGPDMCLSAMAELCPRSIYIGRAVLSGYQWQVNKDGLANLVLHQGTESGAEGPASTPGLVFQISKSDRDTLVETKSPYYASINVCVDVFSPAPCLMRRTALYIKNKGGPAQVLLNGKCGRVLPEPKKSLKVLTFVSEVTNGRAPNDDIGSGLVTSMSAAAKDAMALGVDVGFFRDVVQHLVPGLTLDIPHAHGAHGAHRSHRSHRIHGSQIPQDSRGSRGSQDAHLTHSTPSDPSTSSGSSTPPGPSVPHGRTVRQRFTLPISQRSGQGRSAHNVANLPRIQPKASGVPVTGTPFQGQASPQFISSPRITKDEVSSIGSSSINSINSISSSSISIISSSGSGSSSRGKGEATGPCSSTNVNAGNASMSKPSGVDRNSSQRSFPLPICSYRLAPAPHAPSSSPLEPWPRQPVRYPTSLRCPDTTRNLETSAAYYHGCHDRPCQQGGPVQRPASICGARHVSAFEHGIQRLVANPNLRKLRCIKVFQKHYSDKVPTVVCQQKRRMSF